MKPMLENKLICQGIEGSRGVSSRNGNREDEMKISRKQRESTIQCF